MRLKPYIQDAIRLKENPPKSHLQLKAILGRKGYINKDWLEYQVVASGDEYQIMNFVNEDTKEAVLISAKSYDHPNYRVQTYSETDIEELVDLILKKRSPIQNGQDADEVNLKGEEGTLVENVPPPPPLVVSFSAPGGFARADERSDEVLSSADVSISRMQSEVQGHAEINDLIGNAPSWLLRSGIMMIALVVTVILIMSSLISYPDKIEATGVITTQVPPISLVAHQSGRIEELYVQDQEAVVEGQEILYLDNPADKAHVQKLMLWIDDFEAGRERALPEKLSIGSLQQLYAQLQLTLREYQQELSLSGSKYQVSTINSELGNVAALQRSIDKERQLYIQELELAKREMERAQKLLAIGGISEQEAERMQGQYAQAKRSYESLQKSTIQSEIKRDQLKLEKGKILEQRTATLQEYRYRLSEMILNIRGAYHQWYQDHHMIADMDGLIDLQGSLVPYMTLQAGQQLGFLLPSISDNHMYIKAQAPTDGIAKLDSSATIIIKVDAYPHKEYGTMTAQAHSISLLPYQDQEGKPYYEINIPLPDTLVTNYKKTLTYKPDMTATIEMITEDKSILQRIFEDFLSLIDKT